MRKVKHKAFGEGIVQSITDGYIEVDFSGQVKKFMFPKAFEGFLTTEDEELLQKVAIAKEKADQEAKAAAERKIVTATPISKRYVFCPNSEQPSIIST